MAHGIAKVQHYVPQFLLRNFGSGKKERVHVFDKQTGRVFVTNPRNIAAESGFYDFKVDTRNYTLEPGLSEVEGKAKPLLSRILKEDTLSAITAEERAFLCHFFAIQFTRTRQFKEQWRAMPVLLGEWLKRSHSQEELEAVAHLMEVPDENRTNMEISAFMSKAVKEFAPHFASKIWLLLQTDKKNPFVVGDHPLAMQNAIDHSPMGNLGLAVPGIEIYFPLSPTRALAMWCFSYAEPFLNGARQIRALERTAPHALAAMENPDGILRTAAAIERHELLPYTPENVVNFNSLQVRFAERYLMADRDHFALARQMISNHPKMRGGPRPEVG
jgi:hypothetical protein